MIERNRIHDCSAIEDAAIAVVDSWGRPQGVSVRNNVISKVNAIGIKVYDSQDTPGIYNNTISACGDVAIFSYVSASVMNNLVYGNNGGGSQVSLSGSPQCDYNAYGGSWGSSSAGGSSLSLSSTDWANTVTSPSYRAPDQINPNGRPCARCARATTAESSSNVDGTASSRSVRQ